MMAITQEIVPEDSLLKTYKGGARPDCWGHQGDCFSVVLDRPVNLADFVFAFYTSGIFRIERLILRILAAAPSTDAEARMVAGGSRASFAVWRVGEHTATQLLMCDRFEKTRSWFRVVPLDGGKTILQFGSAVAARRDSRTGAVAIGGGFRFLMKFHVVYSRALLSAAARGVMKKLHRS
jgi:hypothetical protein